MVRFGSKAPQMIPNPAATLLVNRHGLKPGGGPAPTATVDANAALDTEIDTEAVGEAPTAYGLLKSLAVILVAMALGGVLSKWLGQFVTLPGYIGAMICAAVVRNLDDGTRILKLDQRIIDDLGTIALSLFLAMALMSLKLWELLDLALPMLVILAAQVATIAAFTVFVTFRFMGRDYDAAVMAGGHCGFGLGATPNAVANMRSIVERFGPAPRAFLVLPMVGAFFIDFSNALIITAYINLVQ